MYKLNSLTDQVEGKMSTSTLCHGRLDLLWL